MRRKLLVAAAVAVAMGERKKRVSKKEDAVLVKRNCHQRVRSCRDCSELRHLRNLYGLYKPVPYGSQPAPRLGLIVMDEIFLHK